MGNLRRMRWAVFLAAMVACLNVLVGSVGAVARAEDDRKAAAESDKRQGSAGVRLAGEQRRVLVRFREDVDPGRIMDRLSVAGIRSVLEAISSSEGVKAYVMDLRPEFSIPKVMDLLRAIPGVIDVEPDRLCKLSEVPSEPYFPKQWGLHNTGQNVNGHTGVPDADIDAPEAWNIEKGNTYPVVVAVIDTGIDEKHPDLDGKIWRNGGETVIDGQDNDGNGYRDDLRGYNWVGISQPFYNDYPRYLGKGPSSQYYAQSIRGTGQFLTHVGIVLGKSGSPTANVVVSVRKSLDGADLARMVVRPEEVSSSYEDLYYKPLNTPVKLADGATYYLVIRTSQNHSSHYYLLYDLRGGGDYYCEGGEWTFDGTTWEYYADDLCFITNPNGAPHDDNGHGTHCAGIVGAERNGEGIIGVSRGATIMPLKAGNSHGYFWTSDIVSAIYYAADNGADVISMSFGGTGFSSSMRDALAYARRKGVTLVAAAGNSGDSTKYYPAGYDGVIGVGATTNSDTVAYFSTRNNTVDVSAPGVGIYSTLPTYKVTFNSVDGMPKKYGFCSGTSMATPMVAGVAALILSRNPGYSPDQVERAITANADDLGPAGWDSGFGKGRLNALRALKSVPPLPFVRSVNPAEGTVGTTVVIAGKGFGTSRGSSVVYFGNTAAVNYLGWTNTEIRCQVPDVTSGVVNLYVVTGVGRSNAVPFKINP